MTVAIALWVGVAAPAVLATDEVPTRCFIVNTTADTADADPGDGLCRDADGNCSLRAAVQEANASSGRTEIVVPPGEVYSLTLAGPEEDECATGDLDVSSDIVVSGGGRLRQARRRGVSIDFPSGAILDGGGLDRLFDLHAGATLTLSGVRLTGGVVRDADGGAARSRGTLRLQNVAIVAGSALGSGSLGGGVMNDGGTLYATQCWLRGLGATEGGGAIASRGGSTSIDRCRFESFDARHGGAIHVSGDGVVGIRRSTFVSGDARRGGAIWNSAIGTTIDDCFIEENDANGSTSDDGGGGIFNAGGSLAIRDTTIVDNCALNAPQWGGGIYHAGGFLSLERCRVTFNEASSAGGGIAIAGGTASLYRTRFARNASSRFSFEEPPPGVGGGGGLYVTGDAVVTVDRCRILHNTAETNGGGGIYSEGNVTVTRSTIVRNTMSRFGELGGRGGAGVYNAGGTLRIEDSRIARNKAGGVFDPDAIFPPGDGGVLNRDGGGVLSVSGTAVIERTRIVRNRAGGTDSSGGGVLSDGGSLTMRGCFVSRNGSGSAGGGVAIESGTGTLERVTVRGNYAGRNPGEGGGLHVSGDASVTVTGGRYVRNRCRSAGGGIWNGPLGTIVVTLARIGANRASVGRNLFNAGGTFTVDGEDVPAGE